MKKIGKRMRLTEQQKEVLYELEAGHKTIWIAGSKPVIGTGHGAQCRQCGVESEGVDVDPETFKALVKKGAIVPQEYWLSEELSEEGVPA